ncbi:hypothetical protein ACFVW1_31405 [Streptomyces olivochromogenes]|uniref:hypothetical protein n=1 Tax=Streptomyces olivochromogenes TaxID=1963 RepID=UPI0036DC8258
MASVSHTPVAHDQSGRGLLIVRTLANRWSVEKPTVGKTTPQRLCDGVYRTAHTGSRTKRRSTVAIKILMVGTTAV